MLESWVYVTEVVLGNDVPRSRYAGNLIWVHSTLRRGLHICRESRIGCAISRSKFSRRNGVDRIERSIDGSWEL